MKFLKIFAIAIFFLNSFEKTEALFFKRHVSMYERFASFLIRVYADLSNLVFGISDVVIVSMSWETISIIAILIGSYVMYKRFKKGRHVTPNPNNTLQSGVNVFNSLQFDNSSGNSTVHAQSRVPYVTASVLKNPEIFKKGMDGKIWITVMESFLEESEKSEWVRITISYIDNSILKNFNNLNELLNDRENGFKLFKDQFLSYVTVNKVEKEITVNWLMFSDYKQSFNQSIREFGNNVIKMVQSLFPNTSDSNDCDKLMQERFVEGLNDTRLREEARTKMHKVKNFNKDKPFTINDLINYTECKHEGFEKTNINSNVSNNERLTTSDSDFAKRNYNSNFNNQNQYKKFAPSAEYQSQLRPFPKPNQNRNQVTFKQDPINHYPVENKPTVLTNGPNSNFKNKPIIGQAIFNNTLVRYLCDSGANCSTISH